MKLISTILFIFFLSWNHSHAQTSSSTSNEEKFCVFIMDGVTSIEQTRLIDTQIRKRSGIVMSRGDFPTGRYYAVYQSNSDFNQSWFEKYFKEKGITIKCYTEGTRGVDPFTPLTKDTCNE